MLVLGAGGHARVLIDALQGRDDVTLGGVFDQDSSLWGERLMSVPVLGGDEAVFDYAPERVWLVNAVGSTRDTGPRRGLFERFKGRGYEFLSVVHSSARLAGSVTLAEGVQVLAGVIINPHVTVGANAIINTGAIIEHDCRLGAHVHVAPGVTMAGGVEAGRGVHIGIGATLIQNLTLGDGCVIGAGAVVLESVQAHTLAVGVPAKVVRRW